MDSSELFTHMYARVQSASTEQMNMEVDKIQCRIIRGLKKPTNNKRPMTRK